MGQWPRAGVWQPGGGTKRGAPTQAPTGQIAADLALGSQRGGRIALRPGYPLKRGQCVFSNAAVRVKGPQVRQTGGHYPGVPGWSDHRFKGLSEQREDWLELGEALSHDFLQCGQKTQRKA